MYYFCFVLLLAVPVAMFVVGIRWRKHPPAFRSGGLVYRTEITEKSPEVWEFAHIHCGKLWSRFGGIFAVISAALMIWLPGSYEKFFLWILGAQMLVMCVTILIIELFLKNLFDENGNRIA